MDCDIVSTSREKLEKFIRELRRLTTYVKKPYKSLYPSIDLENNIAPNTQIGKIVIDNPVYENENRYANDKYSRGGEFIENLVCDNIIEFSNRWLGLADFKEFLSDIKEYYEIHNIPKWSTYDFTFSDILNINGTMIATPFTYVGDFKCQSPFIKLEGPKAIKPLVFYNIRPDNSKENNI